MSETTTEPIYDYDYGTDSDFDNFDNSELQNRPNTKYCFVVCQIYNPILFGRVPAEYQDNLYTQFLVIHRRNSFKLINQISKEYNTHFRNLLRGITHRNTNSSQKKHPIIRNYKNIISKNNYIKPEIAQCIYFGDGTCIAIIKTFWIRLIQRKWKKVFKERKISLQKIKTMKMIKSLKNREICGNYNEGYNLRHFPKLQGMMSDIK